MSVTPRRSGVLTSVAIAGVLGMASTAWADDGWGSANCHQTPAPLCDLTAGTDGHDGKPEGNRRPHSTGSGNSGSNGSDQSPGDTVVGDDSTLANCAYVKSDYQPPVAAATTIARVHGAKARDGTAHLTALAHPVTEPGRKGAWYIWKCTGPGTADAFYRAPKWVPDEQQSGEAPLISPGELAVLARSQLRLPTPRIASSPAAEQLVNLPTWLWISSAWAPVSAAASVPGVWVTATATPTSVTWSMGDGTTVLCRGAGTPFRPGTDATASSPDCGHTYRVSSAGQVGQAFPVAATVHYTVTWSGAGQSGTFPDMTTNANAAFRVAEMQALNNGHG